MNPQTKRFGVIFWLHLIILILAWSSPFWVPWIFILAIILAYQLQIIFIGDCILTKKQFANENEKVTFNSFLLSLFGINISKEKAETLAKYTLPMIILTLALLWQIILGNSI
ncbi:MAG: hypothetical protein NUV97_02430 [archaeon]|nr:hypothetical protein [archaeon]MCR4323803.1 hypothetical protein [Nanoarchaeota archaeon]